MPQSERHALVLGGGTMGVGIIAMFLSGGWKVDVVSRSAVPREEVSLYLPGLTRDDSNCARRPSGTSSAHRAKVRWSLQSPSMWR